MKAVAKTKQTQKFHYRDKRAQCFYAELKEDYGEPRITCVDLSRIVAASSDSRNKRHHHNMSK